MNCNATAISPVTSKRKISPSFGEWRYRKVERSQAEAGASSSRAASRSIVAPLSPCSAAAWRAVALLRRRTRPALLDAALPHGQLLTVPMLTQPALLAAGAAIVSDATSISPPLSVLPSPGQPSTPTPLPIYASKFQPDIPAWLVL
ncbi:uncharacterized protein UHOD_11629 [Ustilago sp. UG-2017b]|nr:uncharacterized protein UHOD_11629 [Ustilago sp. UG-2017b]